MLQIGQLNQRVTIEQRTVTRGADYGDEQISWTPIVTLWANVSEQSAAEQIREGLRTSWRRAVITIRWPGQELSSDMRLRTAGDDRCWQITSMRQLRKRLGYIIDADEWGGNVDPATP